MRIQKNGPAIAVAAIALLATAGCATNSQPNDDAPGADVEISDIDGTTWSAPDSAEPYLTFASETKVEGNDGCNGFSGEYAIEGDTITLSNLMSTMKACPDVDTWLSDAATAAVDGETLTVFDSEGEELGTLSARS